MAGRVDHKGDETVLLADTVWTWEQAIALGPEAFRQQVAAGDRGRRGGRNGRNGYGGDGSNGNGANGGWQGRVAVPVGTGTDPGVGLGGPSGVAPGTADPRATGAVVTIPRVSPLRGGTVEGTIEVVLGSKRASAPAPERPAEPRNEPSEPSSLHALASEASEEPPWPDEAQARLVAEDAAATLPVDAGPGQVLHVRFRAGPSDAVVHAMEQLRDVLRARPGSTPVVLHLPASGGREQDMQLPSGTAYDAELLADVRRRLGGLVELSLG